MGNKNSIEIVIDIWMTIRKVKYVIGKLTVYYEHINQSHKMKISYKSKLSYNEYDIYYEPMIKLACNNIEILKINGQYDVLITNKHRDILIIKGNKMITIQYVWINDCASHHITLYPEFSMNDIKYKRFNNVCDKLIVIYSIFKRKYIDRLIYRYNKL
jgi:hypothetical protein